MAKCDLQVLLDEPQRTYFPGEEIKGHVQVETDGECKCDGLDIVLEHSTYGKGNNTSKVLVKEQVFIGKWVGQSRHQYPFSFRIPEDARPYHGTLLNVAYQVRATADIPWALDPKDTAPVTVAYTSTALTYGWDEDAVKKDTNPGCFFAPLVMLLFGVAGMTYAQLEGSEFAPMALISSIIGLIGVLIFGRGWLASKRLGAVDLRFEMGTSGGYRVAEDKDAFFITVKAESAKSITGVIADLKVFEQVVRGSGSNRRSYSHPLFESSVTLDQSGEGHYRGRIGLPPDGECPPAISLPDNRVIWRVTTRVDIPNWPDWTKKVDLNVTPKKTTRA